MFPACPQIPDWRWHPRRVGADMARLSAFVPPGQPLGTGRIYDWRQHSHPESVWHCVHWRHFQNGPASIQATSDHSRLTRRHSATVMLLPYVGENRWTVSPTACWSRIQQRVRQTSHHNWRPSNAISDFDIALVSAIQTELPRTRLGLLYVARVSSAVSATWAWCWWRNIAVMPVNHDAVDDWRK